MQTLTNRILVFFAALAALLAAAPAWGLDADRAPVAVRWWGGSFITIESWWGLTVAIDPAGREISPPVGLKPDLVLLSSNQRDATGVGAIAGNPFTVRGVAETGAALALDLTLDRRPNESARRLSETAEATDLGPHPVRVWTIPAQPGASMFLIETDGVRILHAGSLAAVELTPAQLDAIGRVDALIVPATSHADSTIDPAERATRLVHQLAPRYILSVGVIGLTPTPGELARIADSLPNSYERRSQSGNTLAVTAPDAPGAPEDAAPIITTLGDRPWKPADAIATGLARVAAARESLARTIQGISAAQLDHQPADGSHTVRWNGEHTAGSEAIFFSIVLRDSAPDFPMLRLSPPQRVSDYSPANPEFSPREEAEHLHRVGALVERFAYILADVDPASERYPVFFRSINGLFELLERHYNQHHDNVKKKFEAADWPSS